MDFFKNKAVKVTAWVLLVASSAVLIIGGATAEVVNSGVVLTAGIVTEVSALIAFITKNAE